MPSVERIRRKLKSAVDAVSGMGRTLISIAAKFGCGRTTERRRGSLGKMAIAVLTHRCTVYSVKHQLQFRTCPECIGVTSQRWNRVTGSAILAGSGRVGSRVNVSDPVFDLVLSFNMFLALFLQSITISA